MASSRKRRHWPQRIVAQKIGITQARYSQVESGDGLGVPTELWFAIADALGVPFRMEFGRDPARELEDAGHLEMQELMLRLGREVGLGRQLELPTKPANPSYSVDVCLRDDRRRVLVLEECWNTFGNIGASVRSTNRKLAETQALAVALGGEAGPYRVAAVWVVRDTPRNRAVLARYPETFDATFTASSREWVNALTTATAPVPAGLGLVWCEPRHGRLSVWRRTSR